MTLFGYTCSKTGAVSKPGTNSTATTTTNTNQPAANAASATAATTAPTTSTTAPSTSVASKIKADILKLENVVQNFGLEIEKIETIVLQYTQALANEFNTNLATSITTLTSLQTLATNAGNASAAAGFGTAILALKAAGVIVNGAVGLEQLIQAAEAPTSLQAITDDVNLVENTMANLVTLMGKLNAIGISTGNASQAIQQASASVAQFQTGLGIVTNGVQQVQANNAAAVTAPAAAPAPTPAAPAPAPAA